MILSLSHLVLEGIQLTSEALASRTNLAEYGVVCFNGKFSHVPLINVLIKKLDNIDTKELVLNFDCISHENWLFKTVVPFEFSEACVTTFCQAVNDLPRNRIGVFTIRIGTSI